MSSCACGMAALAFGSPLWAVGRGCLFSPPLPQALAPRRPRRRPNAALTAVPGSAGRCAPTSVWVERSASIDIEADGDELFVYYSDLETLPEWSPWVKAVRIDPHDPLSSQWTLGARGLTFSWRARITAAVRGERIGWRSEGGLSNEGRVTFSPRSAERENAKGNASSASASASESPPLTAVTLAIRFDVPRLVAAVFDAGFVSSFVDNTLRDDLARFRDLALRNKRDRLAAGRPAPAHAAPIVERAIEKLREQHHENVPQSH